MKLCVSTLGCPDWPLEQIVSCASRYGYDGLELRGIEREFDFAKIPAFEREALPETAKLIADAGLTVVVVGSSAKLSSPLPEEREANLKEARYCIKLAGKLGAPYVRVFGGKVADDIEKEEAAAIVGNCLRSLAEYAEDRHVTPLLETHDAWVRSPDVVAAIECAEHRNVGVIWDVRHPFHAGEAVEYTYKQLRRWICHVHLKDEDENGACLMGQGRVPNFEAIRWLTQGGYEGYFALEWEKAWMPEIAEPEVAFPQFVEQMNAYRQMLG